MNRIFALLRRPRPYLKKRWLVVAITTVWIFLVVAVFQPFGLQYYSHKIWAILYFTFSSFLSSFTVTYIFPLLFKNYFSPAKWTHGKFFLFSISISLMMLLFTVAFLYFALIGKYPNLTFKLPGLLELIVICITCGVFPTIVIYFVEERLESNAKWEILRKQSQNLELLNEIESGDKVTLYGQTKESISFFPQNFLYAEVIKNYVTICFLEHGQVVSKPIRSTLARIMDDLKDYPEIIRCHRAFLVNTSKIIKEERTSAGGSLTLDSLDTSIPVSRTYIKQIEDLLTATNK